MDPSRWLTLIVLMTRGNGSSGVHAAPSTCKNLNFDQFQAVEGEAFHVQMPYPELPDTNVTWYKNASRLQTISLDERERIHHHGSALFLFNLHPDDSGLYIAQERKPSGRCYNHLVGIEVVNSTKQLSYGEISDADMNKAVGCPPPIANICRRFPGNFTWYKDFSLLQGQHKETLWITNTSKADNGLYTCMCTWRHNDRTSNSSGSRQLIHQDPSVYLSIILSPSSSEMFADEGEEIKLNCSFLCGINVQKECPVTWYIDGNPFTEMDGYTQLTDRVIEQPSRRTVDTAVLTISKVSAQHFHTEFKCLGEGLTKISSKVLSLKRRQSIVPSVIAGVCVLFFCVFLAILAQRFAIDIALFFRRYIPFSPHTKDFRLYDAYVVYQTQGLDSLTENALGQFVTQILPSVLEKKCGYRLFIHGRDDIPGEDRLEMVEDCMEQSRRLIVILTPGPEPESQSRDKSPESAQNSVMGGFDWQVGLHHALLHREMSVILIQLGATGPQGYSHLPLGLQHLIRQSAPIRWTEGSRGASEWNSRFWKRVRYLMPVRPARTRTRTPTVFQL